ncbi:hypothetical protein Tco_0475198 [Tanacetum coccineum]
MSSITAQQIKLDLELVPKEKRLEIRKMHGRLIWKDIERKPNFNSRTDSYTSKREKVQEVAFSSNFLAVLVSPEEPTRKSKRDTPEMPLSKKKEKVYVARGKGIELLSNVALTKEAHDVSLCCMTKPLLSLDILLPSIRFPCTVKVIEETMARSTDTPYLLDGYGVLSSWVSRMLLYIKVKERRKLLMNSVLNGPFKYGTVTVPGTATAPATVKDRTYDELIDAEKIHEGCDIKPTNIVLQVLPQD